MPHFMPKKAAAEATPKKTAPEAFKKAVTKELPQKTKTEAFPKKATAAAMPQTADAEELSKKAVAKASPNIAVASRMSEVASSSFVSCNVISFPDRLAGRRVSLALVADRNLMPISELRAQIKHPLELIKAAAWFFARQSPRMKRHRDEPPPPLRHTLTQFSPRVRVVFGCAATACLRLATAPAGVHVIYTTTGHRAASIMERVTRGRVKKVQETLSDFQAAAAARVSGGRSFWSSAANGDGTSVLCHVIADADGVNKQNGHQRTPLHCAASNGHLEISRLLLQCNADVEAKDIDQHTPLHYAASNGHLEISRLLLQCNADVEAKSNSFFVSEETPLHKSASGKGDLEVCRLLLQRNADVEAKDCHRRTPLHYSSSKGDLEVCRLLLQCNADIEAKTSDQVTPLHCSAAHGHRGQVEVTRLLVESKADVAARDCWGRTALKRAIDRNTHVAAYLRSIGAPQ